MEEENNKNKNLEIKTSKSIYLNKQNNLNQINFDILGPEARNLPNKKENAENSKKQIEQKLTAVKKIQLSPKTQSYKTETFNSHTPLNSKLNIIDSILEKNALKEIPVSREKKIYLYLKHNNENINHSDTNSVFDTPKILFKKEEDISDKLSLDDDNREETNKFNKTNIINNVNNNNVNNIFVNFISSNIQSELSRNLLKDKVNNSFNNKTQTNSIFDDGLNKTSVMKNPTKDMKDSKIIFVKDKQSQSKAKLNSKIENEEKNNSDKLDKLNYYTKIMKIANSFIYDSKNNPFNKKKNPQKVDKKHNNKNNKKDLLKTEVGIKKSKKFLKDYLLKNKSKHLKNKISAQNVKKHSNSFSSTKNIFNHNNQPIFINIISKSPFQEEIDEESEYDITYSNSK